MSCRPYVSIIPNTIHVCYSYAYSNKSISEANICTKSMLAYHKFHDRKLNEFGAWLQIATHYFQNKTN